MCVVQSISKCGVVYTTVITAVLFYVSITCIVYQCEFI